MCKETEVQHLQITACRILRVGQLIIAQLVRTFPHSIEAGISLPHPISSCLSSGTPIQPTPSFLFILRHTYPAHAFHPVPMTASVPFIFHVRVGVPNSLFLLLSPPESSLYFFCYKCVPRDFLPPLFLTGSQE